MIKSQNFLNLINLKNLDSWKEARNEYGWNFLPFVMLLQLTLVPSHIFTTDLLDASTKFSTLSIGMRLGAVAVFILTYLIIKKFKLHIDYYYAFTFFVNVISDAYVSVYSSEENIVTHFLGFGVVIISYSILVVIPPLIYNLVMITSSLVLFGLIYYFSSIPFVSVLQHGGAFILFFIFISPVLNLFRYHSLKNEFSSLQELQKLNQEIQGAYEAEIQLKNQLEKVNESLLEANEELNQKQEEIVAQRDAIEKLYHELSEKNKDIMSSIHYAKRIQSKILPSEELIRTGFPEMFILYKPKDIVSGDFYWYNQTENTGFLLAGDCTGHGVPGALMSMLAYNSLNKVFLEKNVIYLIKF